MGRIVPKEDLPRAGSPENLPGATMVVFGQSRRSGGRAWPVSLKISRSAGQLFRSIKL